MSSSDHRGMSAGKPNVDLRAVRQFAEEAHELVSHCSGLNTHNLIELVHVFAGHKRIVRLVLDQSEFLHVKTFCDRTGLVATHGCKKQAPVKRDELGDVFTVTVDWDDPAGDRFVTIVGRTEQAVRNAIRYEDEAVPFRDFGTLYEFPPCCVEAYLELEQGNEWIASCLTRTPVNGRAFKEANRLAALFDGCTLIYDYFPCCLACEATQKLGRRSRALLESLGWNKLMAGVDDSLSAPILVRSGALLQICGAVWRRGRLEFDATRTRQIAWRASLPEDDVFWRSDGIVVLDGGVRLFARGELAADDKIGLYHNRLLVFD